MREFLKIAKTITLREWLEGFALFGLMAAEVIAMILIF